MKFFIFFRLALNQDPIADRSITFLDHQSKVLTQRTQTGGIRHLNGVFPVLNRASLNDWCCLLYLLSDWQHFSQADDILTGVGVVELDGDAIAQPHRPVKPHRQLQAQIF